MTIEQIFEKATNENKSLTLQEFNAIINESKSKFADLSEGNYVDKQKYLDDLAKRDTQIQTLNDTIKTRDADLGTMQEQLVSATQKLESTGADSKQLEELTANLEQLQTKYTEETGALQAKLEAQAYEFAVRDYANSQKFSSGAAKRDFISSMLNKNLPMENGTILGADDFAKVYRKDNGDAFFKEVKSSSEPKPQFAQQSGGKEQGGTKMSLSELMQMKNENPNAVINFD